MINSFAFARTPKIIFGSGKVKMLPQLIHNFGPRALLLTGKSSFISSEHWDRMLLLFESSNIKFLHHVIDHEPSPEMIDECVDQMMNGHIDVVVAIGGGSVVDAGKAVSAMLKHAGSVRQYLEGVGDKKPTGAKVPYIAVPTTSGTGAEATKNAVISEVGENGYKKSLRHDNFVPDIALVDPELVLSCPPHITARSGMDAFTQLLESYVSTNASEFTDALAVDALRVLRDALPESVDNGDNDLSARMGMAYAAMISGITLANAGLGVVHGFASSVGGYFDIPHGLICGTLMSPANKITVKKLRKTKTSLVALEKYARIGKVFSKQTGKSDLFYIDYLLNLIEDWTDRFDLEKLSEYDVKGTDVEKVVKVTACKYNPVPLNTDELSEILDSRI